jgi:hypothetical protein
MQPTVTRRRGAIAVALGYTLMIAAVVAALGAPAPIVAAATGATTSSSDVMLATE